jgi:glycosyltransferase involved in cell wall biosynthesis
MTDSSRPRARIFFPNEWLGVAPTILNLTRALTDRDYEVDVHVGALDARYPAPNMPVTARVINASAAFDFPDRLSQSPREQVLAIQSEYQYSLQSFAESIDSTSSHFNVGVDCRGALAARFRHILYGEPYVFLSLELPAARPDCALTRLAHHAELDALRNAEAVVIQDEDRAAVLARHFSHASQRQFLLPNSPPDLLSPAAPAAEQDNFFRRKFKLSTKRYPYLVAQIGMASYDVFAKELATATKGVPEFAFIFHERSHREQDDPEIQTFKSLNSENLFLSLEPLPYERLAELYSSADIGIVYYRPYHDNNAQIAFASGKLAFFLRHGIPVVINDIPSLVRLNEKYGFGCVISRPGDSEELSAALKCIVSSYAEYGRNARRCFIEEFEFSRRSKPLFEFLAAL